ncbi:MAG: thioredoxin family protein [Cyanobacteria bacterium P01_G01_bin.67]
MVLAVNETNFQREVLDASQPVLVHFWTPWCGLCKLINPTLGMFQQETNDSIKLVSINADENFKLTNYYRLRNLPTIMLFHNGKLIKKLDNFDNRDRLQVALAELINNSLSLF